MMSQRMMSQPDHVKNVALTIAQKKDRLISALQTKGNDSLRMMESEIEVGSI
jgi:dsDNA-binding SOS-regulon protein